MTAVEWLVEQLAKNGVLHSSDIAEAKEMDKQAIINAYDQGYEDGYEKAKIDDLVENVEIKEGIDYYNETFKSE